MIPRALIGLAFLALWNCSAVQRAPMLPLPGPVADVLCPMPPKQPLTYQHAAPVFVAHCNSCHDARLSASEQDPERQAKKARAQKVFESSSYPFATARPQRLLSDMDTFVRRSWITVAEKCAVITWIKQGALDDAGQPPTWRPHLETGVLP